MTVNSYLRLLYRGGYGKLQLPRVSRDQFCLEHIMKVARNSLQAGRGCSVWFDGERENTTKYNFL